MAMIFQSVSPSSTRATTPRTLTTLISPVTATVSLMSRTSKGSLSPLKPVCGQVAFGSSQVYLSQVSINQKPKAARNARYLRKSSVVPWIAFQGEQVLDVSQVSLLDVLLDGIHRLPSCYLKPLVRLMLHEAYKYGTSNLAFDHLGISQIMWTNVTSLESAYRGTS